MSRFVPQLQTYFRQGGLPANNEELRNRLHKAAEHYTEALNAIFRKLRNCPVQSDNRALATEAAQPLSELFEQVQCLMHAWSFFPTEWTTPGYLQHLRKRERSRKKIDVYSGTTEQLSQESAHPELFQQIRNWRDETAKASCVPVYRVLSTAAITEISMGLPLTREDLLLINGIGKTKINQHGEELLHLIQQYCIQHELTDNMDYLREQKRKTTKNPPEKSKTKVGDRIAIMRDGALIQVGTPEELVANPKDEYVANFVRDIAKSHVLTLRYLARPRRDDEFESALELPANMIIREATAKILESHHPVHVVENGKSLGVVSAQDVLALIAGVN